MIQKMEVETEGFHQLIEGNTRTWRGAARLIARPCLDQQTRIGLEHHQKEEDFQIIMKLV